MISAANLSLLTDDIANFYVRALGDDPYGLGNTEDTDRAREALGDFETHLLGTTDLALIGSLATALVTAKSGSTAKAVTAQTFTELVRRLESIIASYQIPNAVAFDTFVAYLNTGNGSPYWQCLLHPVWRDLWPLFRFGATLAPSCVYQVGALGTWTPGGGFVAGSTINHLHYAGGRCEIDVVGHAGNFDVTVTGVGFDPVTKAAVAGSVWTKTAVAADGVHVLTSADDRLIVQATAVAVVGTNPTSLAIRADAPTGRPSLP